MRTVKRDTLLMVHKQTDKKKSTLSAKMHNSLFFFSLFVRGRHVGRGGQDSRQDPEENVTTSQVRKINHMFQTNFALSVLFLPVFFFFIHRAPVSFNTSVLGAQTNNRQWSH